MYGNPTAQLWATLNRVIEGHLDFGALYLKKNIINRINKIDILESNYDIRIELDHVDWS